MRSAYGGRARGRETVLNAATGMRRLRSMEADQEQVRGLRKSAEVRAVESHKQGMRLRDSAESRAVAGEARQAQAFDRAREHEIAAKGRREGLPELAFGLLSQADPRQAIEKFNAAGDLDLADARLNPDKSATLKMADGREVTIDPHRLGGLARLVERELQVDSPHVKGIEPSKRFGVIEQAMIDEGFTINDFIHEDRSGRRWLSDSGMRARDLADELAERRPDASPREIARDVAARLGLENPRDAEVETLRKNLALQERRLADGSEKFGIRGRSREDEIVRLRGELRKRGVDPGERSRKGGGQRQAKAFDRDDFFKGVGL